MVAKVDCFNVTKAFFLGGGGESLMNTVHSKFCRIQYGQLIENCDIFPIESQKVILDIKFSYSISIIQYTKMEKTIHIFYLEIIEYILIFTHFRL